MGKNTEYPRCVICNEVACDIIDMAVAEGIKANGGKKEALSICLGGIWLDGYMEGKGMEEDARTVLRNGINHYFFI
jgi:hypothetical protein